jgi:hypothetical protein
MREEEEEEEEEEVVLLVPLLVPEPGGPKRVLMSLRKEGCGAAASSAKRTPRRGGTMGVSSSLSEDMKCVWGAKIGVKNSNCCHWAVPRKATNDPFERFSALELLSLK